MRLIGFTGKAGSGKTIASQFLIDNFCYKRFSFADPIKRIAKEIFGWDGKKDARGRRLLQHIGDVGREYNPDIWVHYTEKQILYHDTDQALFMEDTKIVIDDARFDNEAQMIKDLDGIIIEIVGPSYYSGHHLGTHVSENGVKRDLIDHVFDIPDCEGNVDKFNDIFLTKFLRATT